MSEFTLNERRLNKYPQIICNYQGSILHVNECAAAKFRINLTEKSILDFIDENDRERFKNNQFSEEKFAEYRIKSLPSYMFALSERIRSKPVVLYRIYLFRDKRSIDVVKNLIDNVGVDIVSGVIRDSRAANKNFKEAFETLYYGDYSESVNLSAELARMRIEFTRLYRDNSLLAVISKIPYSDYSERHLYKIYPIFELIIRYIADEKINNQNLYNINIPQDCEAIIEYSGFIMIMTAVISILSELESEKIIDISAKKIGDETEIAISREADSICLKSRSAQNATGSLSNNISDIAEAYPEFAVRLGLCQTLAGYAGYGFECSCSENGKVSFNLYIGTGEINTDGLKSSKIFIALDYLVKQTVEIFFPHDLD